MKRSPYQTGIFIRPSLPKAARAQPRGQRRASRNPDVGNPTSRLQANDVLVTPVVDQLQRAGHSALSIGSVTSLHSRTGNSSNMWNFFALQVQVTSAYSQTLGLLSKNQQLAIFNESFGGFCYCIS